MPDILPTNTEDYVEFGTVAHQAAAIPPFQPSIADPIGLVMEYINASDASTANLPPIDLPNNEVISTNTAPKSSRPVKSDAQLLRDKQIRAATEHFANLPVKNAITRNPSHPLTNEYVTRYMQSINIDYKQPSKPIASTRGWYAHIGSQLKLGRDVDFTPAHIVTYIRVMSEILEFNSIPAPQTSIDVPTPFSITLDHDGLASLQTRPILHYKVKHIKISSNLTYRAQTPFQFFQRLRTTPFQVQTRCENIGSIAVLESNLSSYLAGLTDSTINYNTIKGNRPFFLHIIATLSLGLFRLSSHASSDMFTKLADDRLKSVCCVLPDRPSDNLSDDFLTSLYCHSKLPYVLPQSVASWLYSPKQLVVDSDICTSGSFPILLTDISSDDDDEDDGDDTDSIDSF